MDTYFGQHSVTRQHPGFYTFNRKLDVALREEALDAFILRTRQDTLTQDDRLFNSHFPPSVPLWFTPKSTAYPTFLLWVTRIEMQRTCLASPYQSWSKRAIRLASQNLPIQKHYMNQNVNLPDPHNIGNMFAEVFLNRSCPPIIQNIACLVWELQKMVNKFAHIEDVDIEKADAEKLTMLRPLCKYEMKKFECTFHWSKQMAHVQVGPRGEFLMTRNALLGFHNKVCDLLSVLLLGMYTAGVCYPITACDVTLELARELSRLHCQLGNKYFSVAGSLEALVVAVTLNEVDGPDNQELYNNLCDTLMEEASYEFRGSQLERLLTTAPIEFRHELGCLSKIAGHPYGKVLKGAKKLYQRTQEVKKLDTTHLQNCVNLAKESYVRNYIFRHRQWPLVKFSKCPRGTPLLEAWIRNCDPKQPSIHDKFGAYRIDDWALVELGENMKYNRLENYLPYLKDRTISILRSRVMNDYLKTTERNKIPWSETRLLLYYMMHNAEMVDHTKYLDKYERSVDLSELADYLVIRLVPKELELKPLFRFFGCKTYEDRTRMTVQTINAKHFLDMYSDEQAMTLGELDISKKLYAFRNLKAAYKGYEVLYINLDCSAWNNAFRHETVSQIAAETLDRVFGTNLFNKTHLAYQQGLFYVPGMVDDIYWEGQQGGIEGLDQDTWVWVYINQIKTAMLDHDVHYHVFCKGDDFRIAVLISPRHLAEKSMLEWKNALVQSIAEVTEKAGHKIKVQESYGSPRYFTFSKHASVGKIELPEGFRKIQKVYGSNNAFLNCLDDYIGSTFSNAHSACRVMTVSYAPYMVALVWSYFYLLMDDHYAKLSDDALVSLLMVPSLLGGFPIIFLHNMYVRAESDLLSPFLDLCSFCHHHYPPVWDHLKHFLRLSKSARLDLSTLYADPYSLPVKKPPAPSFVMRQTIIPEIKRIARNREIVQLVKAAESPVTKSLVQMMSDSPHQPVKVFSVIYSALPISILNELTRRFETGKSVLEAVMVRTRSGRKKGVRLIRKLLRCEDKLQTWRASKVQGREPQCYHCYDNQIPAECPANLAQIMRDELWDRKITTITMPPMSHLVSIIPSPDYWPDAHQSANHFTYHVASQATEALRGDASGHWLVSGHPPFLGHATRTGQIEPQMNFIMKNTMVLKLKNLLDLRRWVDVPVYHPDGTTSPSNLKEVIENIIQLYTELPIAELDPFAGRKRSGTTQHHLRSAGFVESVVPNSLSNIYQQVVGSSNSHQTFTTSGEHFLTNFLHIHCWVIHALTERLEFASTRGTQGEYWAITTSCKFCSTPIREEGVSLDMRLLPDTAVEPLLVCNITEATKDIVTASMREFQKEEIVCTKVYDKLTYRRACVGVLQEVVRMTYDNHLQLQSRHGQHSMTLEAQSVLTDLSLKTSSRIIGDTELKRSEIRHMIPSLATCVYEYGTTRLSGLTKENAPMLFGNIPGSELPWYRLMERLHTLGRLKELVKEVKRVSGVVPPIVQDNISAASTYMASALCKACFDGTVELVFSVLSYRPTTDVLRRLKPLAEMLRWKVFRKTIFPFMRSVGPMGEEGRLELAKLVLVGVTTVMISTDIEGEIIRALEAGEAMILGLSLDEFDEMMLEDHWPSNVEASELQGTLGWFIKKWPGLPWSQAREKIMRGEYQTQATTLQRDALTFEVEIFHADLGDCIARVREGDDSVTPSTASEASSSDSYAVEVPSSPPGRLVFGSVSEERGIFQRVKLSRGLHDIEAWGFSNCQTLDKKIRLQSCFGRRPFGSGTTSCNKVIQVFASIGLSGNLGNHLKILCAGEGYGGIIDYLARVTSNSTFYYATLPPSIDVTATPDLAMEALKMNDHVLDDENMRAGIYDLRRNGVYDYIRTKTSTIHIMVVDAQVPLAEAGDSALIASKCTSLFSQLASPTSVLLIKQNMGLPWIASHTASALLLEGFEVTVCKPEASSIGYECYILAHSKKAAIMPPRPLAPGGFYETVAQSMDTFIQRYNEEYFPYPRAAEHHIQETVMSASESKLLTLVPPAYQSRFLSVFGLLSLPKSSGTLASFTKDDQAIASQLKQNAQDLLDILHDRKRVVVNRRWDDNTHTHYVFMAMKYLTIQGARAYLKLRAQPGSTEADLRSFYLAKVDTLPRRVQIVSPCPQHYSLDHYLLGNVRFNPYLRFMEGVQAAQLLCSHRVASLRYQAFWETQPESDMEWSCDTSTDEMMGVPDETLPGRRA
ncbi:polymerase [Wenzhou crab virus 2]|uniref:RNA-directed RNA polymerase n=1 Tax=Wenzhou crab virus 2 TaxID=1608092 RepID=A0A0B5KJW3_9VIRU|nr:polymerase [Wenzhou crab virus 2]AJG39060.1 polymerase [Wenzhou crab virus 2]